MRTSIFTVLIACLAVIALAVSGCGGDTSSGTGTGTGSGSGSGSSSGSGSGAGLGSGSGGSTGTADTVVAAVNPTGTISTYLRTPASATVTFTTNDGTTATQLALTTATSTLPAGWSVSSSTLPCATVSTGAACSVTLDYDPPTAGPAGALALNYSYTNNQSQAETGTVSIPYAPQAHNAYVINSDSVHMSQCAVSDAGALSNCTQVASPLLSQADQITVSNGVAYITDNSVVQICGLSATGLSGCTSFSGGLYGPRGIAFYGTYAYVVNTTGSIGRCLIGTAGTLSQCATMIIPGSSNPNSVAVYGSTLFMANAGNNEIIECALDASGNASSCTPGNTGQLYEPTAMTIVGSTMYVMNQQVIEAVPQCTINSDGLLAGCADSGARGFTSGFSITFLGNEAYIPVPATNQVYRCDVGTSGALSNCSDASTAASTLNAPVGILFY